MINVLFVCLGNICRSPMAEGIFKDLVEKEGLADQFHIDSVGTGSYHIGDPAHPGTRRVLADHGIKSTSISRQINARDVTESDYLIAMDQSNARDLNRYHRSPNGKVQLLLEFAQTSSTLDVPDPYYTGDFEGVYRLVEDGCRGLLTHIREEQGI